MNSSRGSAQKIDVSFRDTSKRNQSTLKPRYDAFHTLETSKLPEINNRSRNQSTMRNKTINVDNIDNDRKRGGRSVNLSKGLIDKRRSGTITDYNAIFSLQQQLEDGNHLLGPTESKKSLKNNNVNNSPIAVHRTIDKAVEKLQINFEKNGITKMDIRNIISEFKLKCTEVQLTEGIYVSCGQTMDLSKFTFDAFARWMMKSIPLMHEKDFGFNLPQRTAKSKLDSYYKGNHFETYLDKKKNSMIGFPSPSKSTMSHFPSTTKNSRHPNLFDFEKSNQIKDKNSRSPQRCLDLSCGDPYYNLRQEQRELNEDDELELKIQKTLDHLSKFPRLKRDVQSQLKSHQHQSKYHDGMEGIQGSHRSRLHIREYFNNQRQADEQLLDKLLKNEPSACRANHMSKLLNQQWTEPRNAYKMFTKIDAKQESRIKKVLNQGRYDNKCVD